MTQPPLPQMPSFRLDGRHALVTGAGRGIGVAIATALAQQGAHVHLAARSAGEVGAVAEALRAGGWRASAVALDVTDVAAVQAAVAALPVLSVLVNNAGTNRPNPITEVSLEDFDAVFGLNVRALYAVTQAVVRRMLDAGTGGSIINITSQMGHVGGLHRTLYCGTKHAVEGITKALALELAPRGIRVNAIAPTFIETSMTRPFFAVPGFRDQMQARIPLGRLGQVEDIMGAAAYLASDAAALVTGTSLLVDGGWTAQ
ncbi:MAG: glucose 1-dehydrogenase [Acetobacteraceae bacterium]|nr:glucose 1-dehydrogenase [Acetobacteraceae bacterium]